jgi:penicillin G amidase
MSGEDAMARAWPDRLPGVEAAPPPPRRRRRRLARFARAVATVLALALVLLLVLAAILAVRLRGRLAASLPATAGEAKLAGLAAPVRVERDALGVPTLRGANRLDLARALGYVHAQERFFEMDLALRRRGAGETAALLGPPARQWDREHRPLRLRALARRVLAELPAGERALLEAYAAGVNAGLASLHAPPFEYLALGVEPRPWQPEDSVLAALSLFDQLQLYTRRYEIDLGLMHDLLPPALFTFLSPPGTEWDAPLAGEPWPPPAVPPPAAVDLRRGGVGGSHAASGKAPEPQASDQRAVVGIGTGFRAGASMGRDGAGGAELADGADGALGGSNCWAVDGRHAAAGHALLANDVHLPVGVPNLWYRACLAWPAEDGTGPRRVCGATLPGLPVVVVGSNGHVAWGLTSSLADASDVVVLDVRGSGAGDQDVYLTPQGPRRFTHHAERLHVNWGRDETLDVRWTIWGPVIGRDHRGRPRALRWVVYEPGAVDLGIAGLEAARTTREALDVARRSGAPAQNFIVADEAGRIGWTILGRLPRRVGFDGRLPGSWADGSRRWDGLLPPEQVPEIADPRGGRLWSANNRPLSGEPLARLGDGGYRSGARARQIRDDLFALPAAGARDMLAIQLDDRALFLARWQRLLQSILTPRAVAGHPGRRELRDVTGRWEGRAAAGSASFRLVRAFRIGVRERVFTMLAAPCLAADPGFDHVSLGAAEGPLWQLVTRQPANLLAPRYRDWQDLLLSVVDEMLAGYAARGGPLARRTWGELNTTDIRHPFSRLLPLPAGWLDMPHHPLAGEYEMPRVQLPPFAPTLRMVVSPGREQEGFFTMPAGQSGHPWSAHYRDSHPAWERADPAPFLPGATAETLILRP